MGTLITRTRNGRSYTYYRVYGNGGREETYCGAAGAERTRRKALRAEITELEDQKRAIAEKLSALRRQMREVGSA